MAITPKDLEFKGVEYNELLDKSAISRDGVALSVATGISKFLDWIW